jgi:hypothetical protein
MPEEELSDSVVVIPAGALLFLTGEIERLKTHIVFLERKITALELRQDEDCDRIARDIAYDRQRITRLEEPPDPTPSQKDRGEILRALLAANGGKLLVKEARRKMRLSKAQFSQLLASMKDSVEIKPYHLDKRQRLLMLK